ncbi:MAG: PIN domain-containing protein [Thermoplasmatota archaeon]
MLVVDTNALLLPFRDGTDLQGEVERLLGAVTWVVPSCVLDELNVLAEGNGKDARAAKMALQLATSWQHEATSLPGDDGVLEVATRLGAAVLTDDKRLVAEAKQRGLRVLRSRGHGLAMA